MEAVISVENLGKEYRLGASDAMYATLREALVNAVNAPFKSRGRNGNAAQRTIWALRDLNFEVNAGEVVGIIGRNGAGKSTLLRILSRVTEPTTGQATIYGRVGSLLEVGTGFHPELTGRENISLNGSILGMTRKEIAAKLDEIISFAEVEKFIDTPVKRYSSGMYVRLAFAVAAHLEPEILIVDEVLAVGDSAFQLKCLSKMQEIRSQGRTILFVSHNMQAIGRLCQRAICLSEGRMTADGPAREVVKNYLASRLHTSATRIWPDAETAPGNEIARLRAVRLHIRNDEPTDVIDIRQEIGLEMQFEVLKAGHVLVPNYHLFNEEGICIFVASDHDPSWKRRPRPQGLYTSTAWIPGNYLSEGTIAVGVALSTFDPLAVHFHEEEAVVFQVLDAQHGDSARGDFKGPMPGIVRPLLTWETEFQPLELSEKAVDEISV